MVDMTQDTLTVLLTTLSMPVTTIIILIVTHHDLNDIWQIFHAEQYKSAEKIYF